MTSNGPDIQELFKHDGLNKLWGDLIERDKSILKKNEDANTKGDNNSETRNGTHLENKHSFHKNIGSMFNSWMWRIRSDQIQVDKCLDSIKKQQRELLNKSCSCVITLAYTKQQLVLIDGCYKAFNKDKVQTGKLQLLRNNSTYDKKCKENVESMASARNPNQCLALVGSRAVLHFAFAFLKRAWRSGEDGDLCSDLLDETLTIFQCLPAATFFNQADVSGVWAEVIKKSKNFFRVVAKDDLMGGNGSHIPIKDRQAALSLYLELSLLQGTLTSILDSVMFLLQISTSCCMASDQQKNRGINFSPLISFIKRLSAAVADVHGDMHGGDDAAKRMEGLKNQHHLRVSKNFLKYMDLPSNNLINLKDAAIISLCYLDSHASRYLQPADNSLNGLAQQQQEIVSNGDIFHLDSFGFQRLFLESLNDDEVVVQMACSKDCMVVLTNRGSLYSISLTNKNGKFQKMPADDKMFASISSHWQADHFLAVTSDGLAYSWGEGQFGQLGHGPDNMFVATPMQIKSLSGKFVTKISCSCLYSAFITSSGELYICGGTALKLMSDDVTTPMLASLPEKVIDVACETSDSSFVVCCSGGLYALLLRKTASTKIEVEYGMCCDLSHVDAMKVVSAPRNLFAVVSKSGKLHLWNPSGEYIKLIKHLSKTFSDNEGHFSLNFGEKVVDVSFTSSSIVVLLESGRVVSWNEDGARSRRDDHFIDGTDFHHRRSSDEKPDLRFVGICCAKNHSFAWTSGNPLMLPDRKEFLVDLSITTFELLNQLLSLVFDSINGQSHWPPSQDEECLAVSSLNLLNLQLRCAQSSNSSEFFSKNVDLASSLKQKVISLSSCDGVLETIQKAAQETLQSGWRVLMPSHEERVRSLSTLLVQHNNGNHELKSSSAGGRFMIRLLLESLMMLGELESNIDDIFSPKSNLENSKEIINLLSQQPNSKTKSDMINMTRSHESPKDAMNSILQHCPSLAGLQHGDSSSSSAAAQNNAPDEDHVELLDLVDLIFRNASLELCERIQMQKRNPKSLDGCTDFTGIMLKFQRVFFANLLDIEGEDSINFYSGGDILSASLHLKSYVNVVCQHLVNVFKFVSNLRTKCELFSSYSLIERSFIGSVLPEAMLSLLFLQTRNPSILHFADLNEGLTCLLEELNSFNRMFNGHDDDDDMTWERSWVHESLKGTKDGEGMKPVTLRPSDLDNLLKEGRLWTRNNEKVYDLNKLNDLLEIDDDEIWKKCIGRNSSEIFEPGLYSKEKLERLPECIIGLTAENDPFVRSSSSSSSGDKMSLDHSRKLLSLLLGMQARKRSNSTAVSECEVKSSNWLRSSILTGGLFSAREVRSSEDDKDAEASCFGSLSCQGRAIQNISKDLHLSAHFHLSKFGNERESSSSPRNELIDLIDQSSINPGFEVQKLIDLISFHCNNHSSFLPVVFPFDHPLCEITRFMIAVFIKHLNLWTDGQKMLENECNTNQQHQQQHVLLPDSFANICRAVCHAKKFLIKVHQDSGRSYKEICSPILERCRFLLVEVGPIRDQTEKLTDENVQASKCRWIWATKKILENLGRKAVLKNINHGSVADRPKIQKGFDDITRNTISQSLKDSSDSDSSELKNSKDSENLPDKESSFHLIHHSLKHLDPRSRSIVADVMNFLLHAETVNLELLKQAVLNQNVRASVRLVGLQNISNLLDNDRLDDSTLFYILLGWQGILLDDEESNSLSCLSGVHLISPSDKDVLELEQQKFNDWIVNKLRDILRTIEAELANRCKDNEHKSPPTERTKNIQHKQIDCLSETKRRSSMPIISDHHGDQEPHWSHDGKPSHGRRPKHDHDNDRRHDDEQTRDATEPSEKRKKKKMGLSLPLSRFVPLLMSTLTVHHSLSSLNALIDSGILALVKTSFRIFVNEGDIEDRSQQIVAEKDFQALVDEFLDDREAIFSTFDGPKVAATMKIGSRVIRGPNWNWGNQDGPQPGVGTLTSEIDEDGWVQVEWDSGSTHTYRMGRDGKYDLMLYEGAGLGTYLSKTKEEFHAYLYKKSLLSNTNESSNPLNSLFCNIASNLANSVCLNVLLDDVGCLGGCAASKLANHLTDIIDLTYLVPQSDLYPLKDLEVHPPRSMELLFHGCHSDLNHWSGYGFVRSISSNADIATRIAKFAWIEKLMNFFNDKNMQPTQKLQILLLLESILIHFDSNDLHGAGLIAKKLITTLGNLALECRYDQSMKNNDVFACRGRKLGDTFHLISASHTSTLAEQLRSLVVSLFNSPHWANIFTAQISDGLDDLTDLLSQKSLVDEAFGEASRDLPENVVRIFGILSFLGGVDEKKLRLGGRVTHEEFGEGTISSMNIAGDVSVQFDDFVCEKSCYYKELAVKQLSMDKVIKDTLNERMLKQWSKLLYFAFCSSSNFKISEDPIKWGLESSGPSDPSRQREFIRNCQMKYFLLKASKIVFSNQEVYRKMLSTNCIVVESLQAGEAPSIVGFQPSNQSIPIFRHILQLSTQPSPILPTFNLDDLELALISLFQTFSAGPLDKMMPAVSWSEIAHKQFPNPSSIKNSCLFDSLSLNPSERNSMLTRDGGFGELVQQLVDMGFKRERVQCALKQFGSLCSGDDSPPMMDSVVTWLLDNCSEDIDEEVVFKDVNRCLGNANENANIHGTREFMTKDDFTNVDSYAIYVKENIEIGMLVKCCESYEDVKDGDVGIVQELDNDDLHDLNVRVDWVERGGAYWVGYIHLDLNGEKCSTNLERNVCLKCGDYVKVRDVMQDPFYGWGLINRTSTGIITGLSLMGDEVTVYFPQQPYWNGLTSELERVMLPPSSCQFGLATANHGSGNFFDKCSENKRLASATSKGNQGMKSHSLKLKILKKPLERREMMIYDWKKCIKNIQASSREDIAQSLFETSGGFWQSSGSIGKHWIRLEMHENILINSLAMTINLSDSSYIPSIIIIMAGPLPHQCSKELATIHVSLNEAEISLLENVNQFHRFIEIQVRKCNNDGIDCRVPGLNVVGKLSFQDTPQVFNHLSYLASDSNPGECADARTLTRETKLMMNSKDIQHTYVFVWGLNDKDQLGGPRGSKIKVPVLNEILSSLKCVQIAGGSKSLFCVTQDGKLYASGEATNGRLGLGITSGHISVPRQLASLSQYVIKKIAVHSGGRHALALTVDGKVFSWGEGDDGKLGHFSRLSSDKPRLIEALRSKRVRDIACGSSHSAAIISNGDLYTWGLGEYGRLGHGDNVTQEQPKLVAALVGQRVIQVSLGSRDAQTLALTDEGLVYSWGDGDFGKLGRGGSEGCNVPQVIDKLTDMGVCQVECGAQFSLALTKSGQVWTWGKGDYFRLGHGTDAHVRKPQMVEGLKEKKIVHVAVGALHCLAVTDAGKVYAWGDNDHGQQGDGTTVVNKKPALVHGLERYKISKVSCGSSHSLAWCTSDVPYSSSHEPVAFSPARDPLGTSLLETEAEDKCTTGSDVYDNYRPPSLSRVVFSLETRSDKLAAIAHLMRGLQISYARHAIIEALKPINDAQFFHKPQTPGIESPINEELMSHSCHALLVSRSVHSNVEIVSKNDVVADHSEKLRDCCGDKTDWKREERRRFSSKSCSELTNPSARIRCFTSEPVLPSVVSRLMTETCKKVKSDGSSGMPNASSINDDVCTVTSAVDSPKTESQEGTNQGLDDFTKELSVDDSRMIVDLLKIAAAGRLHSSSQGILSNLLNCLAKSNPLVSEMLLELCVTELEDVSHNTLSFNNLSPVVQESQHPYVDNSDMSGSVRIPGATSLRVEFDRQCSTERRHDHLSIMDANMRVISIRSGRVLSNWSQDLVVGGDELHWRFRSDGSVNGWGWRFTVYPTTSKFLGQDFSSDRTLISRPSIHLVMCLLDLSLSHSNNHNIILRLAAALATCSQISAIAASHKIWILQKLRTLMISHFGRNINITVMMSSPSHELSGCPSLVQLVKSLPETLLKQFEYEDPIVRSGKQLMFSRFFKVLVGLACDLGLDSFLNLSEAQNQRWNWFHKYCQATRVATSLQERTEIPSNFCDEVIRKIRELDEEDETLNRLHESNKLFTMSHDVQLLQWLNRKPDDWVLTSESSGQIWVWGHNHRGQLGGVEGAKIKVPLACEGLSVLRPVQIVGGEQTLFAVTVDGKVYASGYGAGGRLGIGGTESVSVLTLLESIQHVQIKKLSVNSGGKHCLALTSDGDVFSWGEGEDGKLGHGTKTCCDRPRAIETLRGKDIIDVAAGGAHSACISARGELYTWGKGRYGRLGHGDGEDQLKPKLVEHLRDYKVIDVACGSGDAQTLCLTGDDSVWSWGDGDYGKLGRGGSEGCKIPMKIESLQGLGVIKVECGSQFSVALTRAGSVYTWGKGDYHRLGHGTDDHVRKPKRIMSLQGKKVIGIACGSLHCVCCTDSGEVYTWGDNDEGQLGDGTMVAIQKPRIVSSLQGKKINKLACGSAHSFAWSSNKPNYSSKLPQEIPMEFNLLQNIRPRTFRNRLILLHHFSDILCPFINAIDLDSFNSTQRVYTDMLRGLLASSAKESVFKKVVQATMVRDKPHGPVIEINRIQVKRSRNKGGLAGVDGIKSVFGQICSKMADISADSLMLPHRVWKVKFIGESVDDCGGGYSESITEICDELQNGSVAILIQTPNGRDESGSNRDCFILNPSINSSLHRNMFKFFGMLLGIAIRTGSPLNLNLAEPIWKQLVGQNLSITDLDEIDRDFVPGLMRIKDMDDDSLRISEMSFSTTNSSGMIIILSSRCPKIDPSNKDDYVAQALSCRLHEFETAVKYVREGMSQVVPVPLLHLFTGVELETMVCGSPDIPVNLLKSVATYKGVEPNTDLMHWFWEVMEEFTDVERSLFLRFVWGRTRLPRTIADFRGRDFVIQVLDRYDPPDSFLPESYTCFFLLKMPRYSSKKVLREKLKYAIHFCKSIDTDDYARIALTSPHLDTESSNDEDGASCNSPSEGGGSSTDED